MVEIIGVGFMKAGKTYYFDPAGESYDLGEPVIVETARGVELGHVLITNKDIEDNELVLPLKPVIRRANKEDFKIYHENRLRKKSDMAFCAKTIKKHNLNMKLKDVEYTIDGAKIIFYFSADGRIDFRDLVKELANHFKKRIELRQIGVRDEAKMIGGIGICGRPLCCSKWLNQFQPVSIKMAKQQNLSLNPSKLSGTCGRLMCCLNFEHKGYMELRKGMPNEDEIIATPDGKAKVMSIDLFKGTINVRAIEKDKNGEEVLSDEVMTYFKKEIKREKIEFQKSKNNDLEYVDQDDRKEMEELIKD